MKWKSSGRPVIQVVNHGTINYPDAQFGLGKERPQCYIMY